MTRRLTSELVPTGTGTATTAELGCPVPLVRSTVPVSYVPLRIPPRSAATSALRLLAFVSSSPQCLSFIGTGMPRGTHRTIDAHIRREVIRSTTELVERHLG
eukprot:Selendium_serpulae@DN6222_c0_g1_i1.p2